MILQWSNNGSDKKQTKRKIIEEEIFYENETVKLKSFSMKER
jgi:hypothetical protein